MRERLIAILVGLTIGVIVLYGVPRAYMLADLVEKQETEEISRAADFTANRIEARELSGRTVDEALLTSALDETDGASYVTVEGDRKTVGTFIDDPERSIIERRSILGGGELVLTRDRALLSDRVQDALIPLVLTGVGLAALAALLAFFIAGRATAPFRQVAVAARDLGHGRFDLDVPRRGVPEAVAIGAALEQAASQLDEMVRREREFAINASHQLRTPITALRLELEDLTYWPETDPAVAAQLGTSIRELDRLTEAIDDLLNLARRQRRGESIRVDLTAFAEDTVERWQRRLIQDGRSITLRTEQPVPAVIPTGPVAQVLDVLVENARLHGSGAISISTHDEGSHVAIKVADEGARTFGNEVFQRGVSSRLADGAGTGVGLAVAAELAEAAGGHLSLDEQASVTTFTLMLQGEQRSTVSA